MDACSGDDCFHTSYNSASVGNLVLSILVVCLGLASTETVEMVHHVAPKPAVSCKLNDTAVVMCLIVGGLGCLLSLVRITQGCVYSTISHRKNLIKPSVTIVSWIFAILAAAAFGLIFQNPHHPGSTNGQIRDIKGVRTYKDDCDSDLTNDDDNNPFDCDYSTPALWGSLAAFVFLQMILNFVIGFVNATQLLHMRNHPEAAQDTQSVGQHPQQPQPAQYNPMQQPPQSYGIQQPPQSYAIQQPPQSYGIQQPPQSYAIQQPPQSYGIQQPPQSYVVQQVPPGYVAQQPQQGYVVQYPGHGFVVHQPTQGYVVQQPPQGYVVQQHPAVYVAQQHQASAPTAPPAADED